MSERLAQDIARDLRTPGPWPSVRLLCEAADKLEGLIGLLAEAERERDDVRAEVERLKANQLPDGGKWRTEYGRRDPDFDDIDFWSPPHYEPHRRDDVQRSVWLGPVGPIEPVSDSAASTAPDPDSDTQTHHKAV